MASERMSDARLVVRAGEHEWTVRLLSDGSVELDGTILSVRPAGAGTWRIVQDGASVRAYAAADDASVWVYLGGRSYRFHVGPADARRSPARAASDQALASPMPASVRSVLVREGQRVAAGETLVILEAMKMELPIRSARDATVRAIRCREGELVQAGVPLVELS